MGGGAAAAACGGGGGGAAAAAGHCWWYGWIPVPAMSKNEWKGGAGSKNNGARR